jgi:hypothetical protein
MGDPHGLDDRSVDLLTNGADPLKALSQQTMVAFSDCDASPTKAYVVMHRAEKTVGLCFERCLGRKPRRELYDLRVDPHCVNNVLSPTFAKSANGTDDDYGRVAADLEQMLVEGVLKPQGDPRVVDAPEECRYEKLPYTALIGKYTTDEGKAFLQKLEDTRASWRNQGTKARL